MDKMKILLRVIKIGAVIGLSLTTYIIVLNSAVIAELYLVGLLFPGIANSEVLTKLVTLTLICTTACVIAFTATYLLQQHLTRKGIINGKDNRTDK